MRTRSAWHSVQMRIPDCGRMVPFNEARFHHIVEHTVGGPTVLQNGILICTECHADRVRMQTLAPVFQDYLQRQAAPAVQPGA